MAKDLHEAFEHARRLFNAGEYDELGAMLDPDVILKRVRGPGSVMGIGDVIAFLKLHRKQQNPQLLNPKVSQKDEGTWGIVSGTADYKNRPSDTGTTAVQLTFIFVRSDSNGDWAIINLFAVPTK